MSDHEWCRDVQRDEAVRAAEDAAAVPSIQHRDLPEQVALLWASVGDLIGRVVRLEAEMDAGQDEEADAASDEAVAHGATLSALAEARQSLAAANRGIARLTAERDAAILERRAAQEEVEDWSRRCARILDERDAARARVAELEAAAPPRGWLTKEDCEAMYLANAVLHGVFVGSWREKHDAATRLEAIRVRALSEASGEAAQPPRGWLTAEEHRAVAFAAKSLRGHAIAGNLKEIADQLDALRARETPPSVKVPSRHVIITTVDARERIDCQWIAAIRAAGGEVEE